MNKMASSKVYVGGLPWTCNADDLKQVCSKFGFVVDAFIVMDRTSAIPRSKGFGFVTFSQASDAAMCLRSLNGSEYGGRILKVGMAHRETGNMQASHYGRNPSMGDSNTGMRSSSASSQSSGFVSADVYGQHSYDGSYGSNFNVGSSNFYGYGTNGYTVANSSYGYDYNQARGSNSMDGDNSFQDNRQYSGYGGYSGYGNKYGDGFITRSADY